MSNDGLTDLFIKTDIDTKSIEITFTSDNQYSSCQVSIYQKDTLQTQENHLLVPGCFNTIKVQLDQAKLWSPSEPNLYSLILNFSGKDSQLEVKEQFGFCKIESIDNWIYVNNLKFYPRAFIRGREAHDHPNLMNLPLEEFYAKNIKAAKEYGFNMVRFHSRVPDETFLKVADELGFFVHVELRKYYGKYQKERSMMTDEGEILDRNQWVETVKSLRNHPCVFAYCMGNEIRHPGSNPYVEEIAKLTKKLDPTRLFIDTCAHGEFDRTYVDFDVQHMSYFYPYGKDYDMFDNTYNWTIYGSCKGQILEKQTSDYKITRGLNVQRPVFAHEICHYVAMHDIENLEKKFDKYCPEQKPWWINGLQKLIKAKGLEKDYAKMIEASRRFQFISWKLGIEAARRSNLLAGFHFLQLSDTERYENSNGIIDCFDDSKGFDAEIFKDFNNDIVILADLPERVFFEDTIISIPVIISNFGNITTQIANLKFELADTDKNVKIAGSMDNIDIKNTGLCQICKIDIKLPKINNPLSLSFSVNLQSNDNKIIAKNSWNIWGLPNKSECLNGIQANINLKQYNPLRRYNGLEHTRSAKLIIAERFTNEIFKHLTNGNDVLMLYRIDETRARINPDASKEEYYLPTTWDRFKGVIWDRGTNCGAFIRDSKALDGYPHNGYIDLQFHRLIDDCDKICLDDFPIKVEPIIQGIDKAVRDRFDVYTYKLSELQPQWTMRKFGYLFELKVGKGRLLISGFNFTGLEQSHPSVCAMFESLVKYTQSAKFNPSSEISVEQLKHYLKTKAEQPRIKERKMTQFWQLNTMPLESDKYWKESEQWIEKQ
jgi:hypothetical protein